MGGKNISSDFGNLETDFLHIGADKKIEPTLDFFSNIQNISKKIQAIFLSSDQLNNKELSELKVTVLMKLKNTGYIDIMTEEGKILQQLFLGFTQQNGKFVEPIITEQEIRENIFSYYRKKGFQSFEKITKLLGIEAVFKKSFHSTGENNKVFQATIQILKKFQMDEIYSDVLKELTFQEGFYLYLMKSKNLGGTTFDKCFLNILAIHNISEIMYGVQFIKYKEIIEANLEEQFNALKTNPS